MNWPIWWLDLVTVDSNVYTNGGRKKKPHSFVDSNIWKNGILYLFGVPSWLLLFGWIGEAIQWVSRSMDIMSGYNNVIVAFALIFCSSPTSSNLCLLSSVLILLCPCSPSFVCGSQTVDHKMNILPGIWPSALNICPYFSIRRQCRCYLPNLTLGSCVVPNTSLLFILHQFFICSQKSMGPTPS